MKKWESSHAQDPHAQDSTSVPNSDSMFWVASEPSEPGITAQKSVLCSAVSTLKCGNQSVLHGSMKETQHQIAGAGGLEKITLYPVQSWGEGLWRPDSKRSMNTEPRKR